MLHDWWVLGKLSPQLCPFCCLCGVLLQAIEEAIARGLPRVEAGAQGEHKLQRGYLPNFTYSCHYITDPMMRNAVGRFLEREEQQVCIGVHGDTMYCRNKSLQP